MALGLLLDQYLLSFGEQYMKRKQSSIKSESGQGVMEYILLSSLIGIFCLLALRNYGHAIRKQINYFKKEINSLPHR